MTLKPLHLFFVFISLLNISFFPPLFVSPQTNSLTKADSLKTALANAKEDTAKVKLLNDLGWELRHQNPDTSILLGKQALEILSSGFQVSSSMLDEMIKTIEPSNLNPETRSLKRLYASTNSNLGVYYYLKGDYSLSLSHHFKALEIRKQLNDKKGIAVSLGNIGLVYEVQGNYPKALKHYFEALVIGKELGDKNRIAIQLGNIGIVYKEQADAANSRQDITNSDSLYTKALKHFFEAQVIDKELGNKNGMARHLSNIGAVYREQANAAKSRQDIANSDSLYAKALKHYFSALEIAKELGNKNGMAILLGNIGIVYADQADAAKSRQDIAGSDSLYAKALKHYFEAMEIDKELGRKSGIAIRLGNVGSLYTQTGRFKEAEVYLDSALVISDLIGSLALQKDHHEMLSHLYDTTARYQLAYHHYKKYSTAKDSLFNEEKSKEIGRLEQNHVFELAELERIQKELESSRQEAAAVGRRNLLQYSAVFLVLVFLFLGIFLLARRFRKIKEQKVYARNLIIVEATLFISFLIFFEFILVLLAPFIENITGGEPAYKLLVNAVLAGAIFPLHGFLEAKLKASVIKTEHSKWVKEAKSNGSKSFFISLLVVLFLNNSFSDKTDSLKTAISNAKEDTAKVNLLNDLGRELMFQYPDTSILLGKQALEILSSGFQVSSSMLDEMIKTIEPSNLNPETRSLKRLYASTNSNLGVYYYLKGDYSLSLSHHFKALEIRKQLNDKKGIAVSLGNIGLVYEVQGNYPKALKHYFEALVIDKELGDKNGMAADLGNIGIVYSDQAAAAKSRQDITMSDSLYAKALKHFFETMEISKELGDKNGMAAVLGNIGIVYKQQASAAKSRQNIAMSDSLYTKALKHYFEAMEISKELGDKNGMARHLGNIGNVYGAQADAAKSRQDITMSDSLYAKALKHFFSALEIDKELGNKNGIAINLGNIGSLYTQTGRFKEAEVYLDSALVIDLEIGRISGQMYRHEALSHLYDTTARYQLAYHHYKKYSTAKDSLFNEEKSKDIGRLEQNHQFEMEELAREIMEKEKSRQEAAAVGRRNLLQYSSIFLGLFFLFGLVFFLIRISLPEWMIELSTFVPFMLLFEFVLVLFDPYIDNIAGGEPLYTLLINALCAAIIFPMHSYFEKKLKNRIYDIKQKKEKQFEEEFRKEAEEYGGR